MNLKTYAASLRIPLFAERPTLTEAYAYAQSLATASENPLAVMTAVQVVVNTIANDLDRLSKEDGV